MEAHRIRRALHGSFRRAETSPLGAPPPSKRSARPLARTDRHASRVAQQIENANDGTASVQILYSAFLAVLLAGFGIVYSTSHRQLFLDELVSVSVGQSIQVPTSLFYVLFPIVLVFLHFQLLWQMRFSIEKLQHLARTSAASGRDVESPSIRFRLKNLVLSHTLIDSSPVAMLASALLFATIAICPIIVLLFVQLRFLPFHDNWISGLHRVLICIDILLVVAIWAPRRRLPGREAGTASLRAGGAQLAILICVSVCTAYISLVVAVWPGEKWELLLLRTARTVAPSWIARSPLQRGNYLDVWKRLETAEFWALSFGSCVGTDSRLQDKPPAWSGRRETRETVGPSSPEWEDPRLAHARSCDVRGETLIATAAFFAQPSPFKRSLSLRGEILTGEQLLPSEMQKLRPNDARVWTKVSDYDTLLNKVPVRRFDSRDFAHAEFDRARLINVDFSRAEVGGARFSDADMAGASLTFVQRDADHRPPRLIRSNFPRGRIELKFAWLSDFDPRLGFHAPHSVIQVDALLAERERFRATLDAPFSKILVQLDRRGGDRGDYEDPHTGLDASTADIAGYLGYSQVTLRGGAVRFRASIPGGSVHGSATRLLLGAPTNEFSGGVRKCGKTTDMRFATVFASGGMTEFMCADLRFGRIHPYQEMVGGQYVQADFAEFIDLAGLWRKDGRRLQGPLPIPTGLSAKRLFRPIGYLYDDSIVDSRRDSPRFLVRMPGWCTASSGQLRCAPSKSDVEFADVASRAWCSFLLSDAALVYRLEDETPASPLTAFLARVASEDASVRKGIENRMAICAKRSSHPLAPRVNAILESERHRSLYEPESPYAHLQPVGRGRRTRR